MQVSPTEIEDLLLSHPAKSIVDVCVGGVSGGRTSDEKVPRAWIVLSEEGRRRGNQAVFEELEAWARKNLSKYKWLRGGIEAVDEVSCASARALGFGALTRVSGLDTKITHW